MSKRRGDRQLTKSPGNCDSRVPIGTQSGRREEDRGREGAGSLRDDACSFHWLPASVSMAPSGEAARPSGGELNNVPRL